MTSYELMATNSRGENFVITTASHELLALVASIEQAVEGAEERVKIQEYVGYPLGGAVLEEGLLGHFGSLSDVQLTWFDGQKRWVTTGVELQQDKYRREIWALIYGDY